MHSKRTLRYITLLAISFLLLTFLPATAQTGSTKQTSANDSISLFKGIALSVDLFGPGAYIFGSDFFSSEIAVEANFSNRFFPIVEIGYGQTNTTDEDSQFHYKTAAPYFRIGMNYNVQYKRQRPDHIYAGIRLGFTSFKYDVNGPEMKDPVWEDKIPFEYNNINSHALWGEILFGIKAQIYKNFHMGWSLRYRINGYVKKGINSEPWYIPGFGSNSSTKFSASYNLIYQIPW